jgi:hypothetical protein
MLIDNLSLMLPTGANKLASDFVIAMETAGIAFFISAEAHTRTSYLS